MHRLPITIRSYHLDGYGHVNNARYLEFLEEGRWALFESQVNLTDLDRAGEAYVVVSLTIDYRRAASMHDRLILETRLTGYNRRQISVSQQIVFANNRKEVVRADVTLALMSATTGKSMVIEGEAANRLDRLMAQSSCLTETANGTLHLTQPNH